MKNRKKESSSVSQQVQNSPGAVQVGGNYSHGNTNSVSVRLALIGLLVLGGLAIAMVVGSNSGEQTQPNTQQNTLPTTTVQ